MNESVTYDKKTKRLIRRFTWETVDEDGSIQHHYSESVETNRQKRYVRVFIGELSAAFHALTKNQGDALMYIINKASRADNIAPVSYRKLEAYLGVSNQAVAEIMKVLQEKDYVRMVERGQWMYNPSLGVGCYDDSIPELFAMYSSLETYKVRQRKNNKKKDDDENVTSTDHGDALSK
jgi:hypothetical protein